MLQKVIELIEKSWENKSARDPDIEPNTTLRNKLNIVERLILKENKNSDFKRAAIENSLDCS